MDLFLDLIIDFILNHISCRCVTVFELSSVVGLSMVSRSQMFTSFVDAKIISHWEKPDENLLLFDTRLQALKERHGLQMVRTPTYEKALPFHVTGKQLRSVQNFSAFLLLFFSEIQSVPLGFSIAE